MAQPQVQQAMKQAAKKRKNSSDENESSDESEMASSMRAPLSKIGGAMDNMPSLTVMSKALPSLGGGAQPRASAA
jgi:hypothetical protein